MKLVSLLCLFGALGRVLASSRSQNLFNAFLQVTGDTAIESDHDLVLAHGVEGEAAGGSRGEGVARCEDAPLQMAVKWEKCMAKFKQPTVPTMSMLAECTRPLLACESLHRGKNSLQDNGSEEQTFIDPGEVKLAFHLEVWNIMRLAYSSTRGKKKYEIVDSERREKVSASFVPDQCIDPTPPSVTLKFPPPSDLVKNKVKRDGDLLWDPDSLIKGGGFLKGGRRCSICDRKLVIKDGEVMEHQCQVAAQYLYTYKEIMPHIYHLYCGGEKVFSEDSIQTRLAFAINDRLIHGHVSACQRCIKLSYYPKCPSQKLTLRGHSYVCNDDIFGTNLPSREYQVKADIFDHMLELYPKTAAIVSFTANMLRNSYLDSLGEPKGNLQYGLITAIFQTQAMKDAQKASAAQALWTTNCIATTVNGCKHSETWYKANASKLGQLVKGAGSVLNRIGNKLGIGKAKEAEPS